MLIFLVPCLNHGTQSTLPHDCFGCVNHALVVRAFLGCQQEVYLCIFEYLYGGDQCVACVHVCTYVCTCVYAFVYVHVCVCMFVCVCVCVFVSVRMSVHCICVRVCMCLCVSVCV